MVSVWGTSRSPVLKAPLCRCCCRFSTSCSAAQATSISLTAHIAGGGPSSTCSFIDANPPPAPAGPNTLDTILILRLEDGADIFISLRGTFLPSCYGMDLDRWVVWMLWLSERLGLGSKLKGRVGGGSAVMIGWLVVMVVLVWRISDSCRCGSAVGWPPCARMVYHVRTLCAQCAVVD